MEFKLVLVPQTPDEFVLNAERPLCGLAFVEKAGACLRRNLDTTTRMRHMTMGAVARYEISVPQQIAIESGWFDTKSTRYLPCEANVLEKYLFYGAMMSNCPSNRPVYPYYQNEIVLTSYIDELEFLNIWRTRGYPEVMKINYSQFDGLDILPDEDDAQCPNTGDMILDDLLQGNT